MSVYVLTNIDVDDEMVFLVSAGAVTTRNLSEARQFGSRSAASDYMNHFNLRSQGWAVDSVKRFTRAERAS